MLVEAIQGYRTIPCLRKINLKPGIVSNACNPGIHEHEAELVTQSEANLGYIVNFKLLCAIYEGILGQPRQQITKFLTTSVL